MTAKKTSNNIFRYSLSISMHMPIDWLRENKDAYNDTMITAFECLDKQIQKKPKCIPEEKEMGYERVPAYLECPFCKEYIDSEERKPFCCECGQAIDWSDYDD